ncbi:D-glycerate dehydrogenase [Bacillus canaveralius]|uniref:D-glycerate dehydrogenase n=1 Tax=Bacillus canaveralius TaxID=1403243 RepID=A0A2N5GIC9_9BACI|nr:MULTISPECIES: D-glycerate dehydrogenase [Bacillus]PLR80733.1 D-glycerate dehydrogenase [Bacillus canaveralius]PLR81723.1 D-glycerate dehydrogenase [Bacillus sp. V33-4]PLR98389.1 D-glycerate dehydrogenase [Bacillus canaveralius]RSK43052.1 D-glycerate dehydrogenase [Bacillus canaveralius]
MTAKIYVTRKLPEQIISKLQISYEVRMWAKENVPVPREVLKKEISMADGLLCLITESIDEDLLQIAENLKVISNMAVGYNNIDVEAASKRGIRVTNTPGVLTETTADLTFALLMATARRVVESSNYLREGKWDTWSPMLLTGQDIYGATIGIVGLGRIGEAVAKRAKGFDMNILYYNRSRKPHAEKELGIRYTELNELLKVSDFICIMTPYTPETVNLIGKEQLQLMKKTAIVINTARGGIVNETALYEALKDGQIWGAGLDVFTEEPVDLDHPLLSLANVVALPHIGSASIKTRMKMANLAADNLLEALAGNTPSCLVNGPQLDTYRK